MMDQVVNSYGYTPFKRRKMEFHGIKDIRGFNIKHYSVVYGDDAIKWQQFDGGYELAFASLPSPAINKGRPGLGFVIAHQGKTGDYVVLGWWDGENELPINVFIRDNRGWRVAQGESFCVWDLEIIWYEREAYVTSILKEGEVDYNGYLESTYI